MNNSNRPVFRLRIKKYRNQVYLRKHRLRPRFRLRFRNRWLWRNRHQGSKYQNSIKASNWTSRIHL